MDNLSVAIVGGTGNLGSALALRLGAPGVKIIIGSRDAEKAKKAVEILQPNLRAGEMIGTTNQEAVKDANFVVIAVPYEGQAQMVQDLKGQVAVNSLDPGWLKTDLGGPNAPGEPADGAVRMLELSTKPFSVTGGFWYGAEPIEF